MKKYSVWQNAKYVYSEEVKYDQFITVKTVLYVFVSLLIPVIATMIPAIAVRFLTGANTVTKYALVILSVCLMYAALLFFQAYEKNVLFSKRLLTRVLRFHTVIADKCIRTDYGAFESNEGQRSKAEAIQVTMGNSTGIENMMRCIPEWIVNLIGVIVYAVLAAFASPFIFVVFAAMIAANYVLYFLALRFEKKQARFFSDHWMKSENLFNQARDISYGKDIRLYKMEKWLYGYAKKLTDERTQALDGIHRRYFYPKLSNSLLGAVRDIVAYAVLIFSFSAGKIDITTFTFMIGVIAGFSTWLSGLIVASGEMRRESLSTNKLRAFLEKEDAYNYGEGEDIRSLSLPLTVAFRNVTFTYPECETPTIKNLSFTLRAGEKLALIGINGAGKTTIVKLLCGLYVPTEGEILVNGVNVKNFNIDEYHKLIGCIFQDVRIFPFSVSENIACVPDGEEDNEKLWRCLALSGLDEKIASLPKKERTPLTKEIDEDGLTFSGGEMQKLMFARVLYKDAPLLVLDEPTAALDPLAEADMYEKYRSLMKDKTSVFISHRLASTKFCDRILLFERGKIVEEGTHEELLALGGKYAEMFAMQSQYYKENSHEA